MRVTDDYVFFFSGRDFLSNWYPSSFTYRGFTFPDMEHFLMCQKARLFGDEDAFQRILVAPTPKEAKRIGREVQGH